MASLLDVGPLTKKVLIRDVEVEVKGLSGMALFHLLDSFPELRKLLTNAGVPVSPDELIAQAPGALGAIVIDALVPTPTADERPQYLTRFLELALGEQADLVKAIWGLTFPRGVQSFIDALDELQVTGSGWGRGTPSPGPSSSSLAQDTPLKQPGDTHQG